MYSDAKYLGSIGLNVYTQALFSTGSTLAGVTHFSQVLSPKFGKKGPKVPFELIRGCFFALKVQGFAPYVYLGLLHSLAVHGDAL